MTNTDPTQLIGQLQDKPALEAAQAEYKTLVEQTADKIAALVPGMTWTMDKNTWMGCSGEYAQTQAKQAYLMAGFNGPIPDGVWPQALEIAKDAAAQIGATKTGAFKDQPGNHDVYIAGPNGVELRLGTQIQAALTVQSDCRLRQSEIPSK